MAYYALSLGRGQAPTLRAINPHLVVAGFIPAKVVAAYKMPPYERNNIKAQNPNAKNTKVLNLEHQNLEFV